MANLQRQWVETQGISGLDQELTGCHFHSQIIGHIIKWPRPRSVDKRKVFPHYSSFHSKNREKDTIDFRQNTVWHTSPKYWIPDWVQFLSVFISSVVWFSCLMSIETPFKKMVTSENRQQAKWIRLREYWETIGSVGNMIPFLKPWRPWKAASIVCSEDSRRTYSLYPWWLTLIVNFFMGSRTSKEARISAWLWGTLEIMWTGVEGATINMRRNITSSSGVQKKKDAS